jgi:hypothetical protein
MVDPISSYYRRRLPPDLEQLRAGIDVALTDLLQLWTPIRWRLALGWWLKPTTRGGLAIRWMPTARN